MANDRGRALVVTKKVLPLVLLAGCNASVPPAQVDTGLHGLAVTQIGPTSLVPGSRLVLAGHSFVDREWGTSRLRLRGSLADVSSEVVLDAEFVDFEHMAVEWPGGVAAGLHANAGTFAGQVQLEVDSTVDRARHVSPPLEVTLVLHELLQPRVDAIPAGVIFINEPLAVDGANFLLGGSEGTTYAVAEGCYQADGQDDCVPIRPVTVAAKPETPFDRTRVSFPFAPKIAGIEPGRFEGKITLRNVHGAFAAGLETESMPWTTNYQIVPPMVFSVSPSTVSLGQYVDVRGGGFIGSSSSASGEVAATTLLELVGKYTPEGKSAVDVAIDLLPEFVAGPFLRYVLNEEDDLGRRLDLRKDAGTFVGSIRPVVEYEGVMVRGDATEVMLAVRHVRQVIWVNFLPSYVESLRHFGLRAMDRRIRDRVLAVARRDYSGVNVAFRVEEPEDFAIFSQIDLAGPDVNGQGYLGYDNTPGKDSGNQRLHDRIGGVNATTQQDGYQGYGGVFVESFLGFFSAHPGTFGLEDPRNSRPHPLFDETFDPFRFDVGGQPVLAADLLSPVPDLISGDNCPASRANRPLQIACAVWVLGSMIGTTMTHEVGHSLGLANPSDPRVTAAHNPGDEINRLMDPGGSRPFLERAELGGEGPARFCQDEYDYLRRILPSTEPASKIDRPSCY